MPEAPLTILYARLHEAARRQLDALAADDMDGFEIVTALREQAFKDLLARDGELATLDDARLTEIRALISEILETDRELEHMVLLAAARTKEEISTVQQGLNALHAYAVEGPNASYFIDRNG